MTNTVYILTESVSRHCKKNLFLQTKLVIMKEILFCISTVQAEAVAIEVQIQKKKNQLALWPTDLAKVVTPQCTCIYTCRTYSILYYRMIKTTFSILSNIYFNHIKDIIKQIYTCIIHKQILTFQQILDIIIVCFFMCFGYTVSKNNQVHIPCQD